MSFPEVSPSFCLFCFKSIKLPDKKFTSSVTFLKFISFLDRVTGNLSEENKSILKSNYDSGLDKLCDKCESTVDRFCELYHQIKCLELQLDLKLEKIVGKIELSNRIPTRWINVNHALQLTFQNDNVKVEENRNEIRMIRHKIIKSGKHRSGLRKLSTSQPRVSLERYDKGTTSCTNEPSIANNVVEEMMPLSLPISISCEDDPLSSPDDFPKIADNSTIISDTATIKTEPLIEVKLEYPQIQIVEKADLIVEHDINSSEISQMTDFVGDTNETFGDNLEAGESNEMDSSSSEQIIHFSPSSLPVENVPITKSGSQSSSAYRTKCACTLCKKVFRDGWNLKRHMMLVHNQTLGTNWKCGKCHQNFIDKWYLTNHMKNHPTCGLPKKVHYCVECGRTFHNNFHLQKHILLKHTKGKASKRKEYEEPMISLPEQHPKRKRCAASTSQKFRGTGSDLNGEEQRPIKINNCFSHAVNAVYTELPKAINEELMDPLEISPDEIPKLTS